MTTVIEGARSRLSPLAPNPAARAEAVTLTTAGRTDTDAALAMLSRCSRDSLYHRFHGYTDGVTYTRRLLDAGCGPGRPPSHGAGGRRHAGPRPASIDQSFLAWNQAACIGMATISSNEAGVGHLGVLVEDGWQRRGIGTRLIQALIDSARSNGVTRVHADVLGEDQFVLRVLRRVGPLEVAIVLGTYEVDVDLRR